MKKSFRKLLLCLSLAIPMMASCGGAPASNEPSGSSPASQQSNPEQSQGDKSSQGEQSNPSGEGSQGESSPASGDESDIEPYAGDPTHSIESIENVPVSSYSAATKLRLHTVICDVLGGSEEVYSTFIEYMLLLKIGDTVAMKVADFMEEYYQFGLTVSAGKGAEAAGENGENFRNLCYDFLAILKSLDMSTMRALLTKINETATEGYRSELANLTPISWRRPYFNGMSYEEFLILKEHENLGNAEFKAALASYEACFDNYYISESDMESYNAYRQNLEQLVETGAVPSELVNFLVKHGEELRDVLVDDMKLFIDALSPIIGSFLQDTVTASSGRSSSFYLRFFDEKEGYSYVRVLSEAGAGSSSSTLESFLGFFFSNFKQNLGLLKAVMADERLGDLLLDGMIEIMIPNLKEGWAEESSMLAKVNTLENRLKGLSGKHIASFVNLLLKIANVLSQEDLETLLGSALFNTAESGEEVDFFSILDKYVADFEGVLAGISASDKNNLLELGAIFEIDIVASLQEALTIYKNRDLSTEAGMNAFTKAMSAWSNELYQKFYDNFLCLVGGSGQSAKPYEPGEGEPGEGPDSYPIEVSIDVEEAFFNEGVDFDNVYIHYSDYEKDFSFGGTYTSILSDIEYAKEYVQQMSPEQLEDPSWGDEYNLFLAELTISEPLIEIDTSKVGYLPYNASVTINGVTYSDEGETQVAPRLLDRINDGWTKDVAEGYSFNSRGYYSVYLKGTTFSDEDSGIAPDTSTAGWHLYFEQDPSYYWEEGYPKTYECLLYYVVDPADLPSHVVSLYENPTIFLKGQENPLVSGYILKEYEIDGARFSANYQSPAMKTDISGIESGKAYTVASDDDVFTFAILDEQATRTVSYEFYPADVLNENTTPIDVKGEVYVYTSLSQVIENRNYSATFYERKTNQTFHNFIFSNGQVTFTYEGKEYHFA